MRVACAQFAPVFNDAEANSAKMCGLIQSADSDLIVFPEAALTGYCAETKEEAQLMSRPENADVLREIGDACRRAQRYAVVGFCEIDDSRLFNSAILFGPSGTVGKYRKTHMPFIGFDRFATAGDSLPLFQLAFGKLGIAICFDNRFPETVRSYALRGADIVCIPTNWPDTAQPNSEHVCPTRALENRVFIAAANRVGTEKGFWFFGKSKIVSATGKDLAVAGDGEELIVAECDLSIAREKRIINKPGEYELDLAKSRRGDLYGDLSANS